jgi:uncharacterized membrane protein (DUF2068 family)
MKALDAKLSSPLGSSSESENQQPEYLASRAGGTAASRPALHRRSLNVDAASGRPPIAEQHSGVVYWLIACVKLAKGVLLLAAAVGALALLGKDVGAQAAHLAGVFSVDADNTYIQALLAKLTHIDDRTLAQISAGTFFFAGLLLTEGIGLLLKRRWAQYFTIVVTGSFVPLETYELIKTFSVAKVAVLVINVGVVAYLAIRILRKPGASESTDEVRPCVTSPHRFV